MTKKDHFLGKYWAYFLLIQIHSVLWSRKSEWTQISGGKDEQKIDSINYTERNWYILQTEKL